MGDRRIGEHTSQIFLPEGADIAQRHARDRDVVDNNMAAEHGVVMDAYEDVYEEEGRYNVRIVSNTVYIHCESILRRIYRIPYMPAVLQAMVDAHTSRVATP